MNALRYVFLLGLVGLLTGCVTPTDMGYVVPAEPVYNTSPAYYATPVSGYSTMTVYGGYHPGYGGPRYPHHRPPPPHHGNRPGMHGGHGGHHGGGHGGHHGGGKSGGHKMSPIINPQPPAKKPSAGRAPSGKGGAPKSAPRSAPRGAPRKGGGRKK